MTIVTHWPVLNLARLRKNVNFTPMNPLRRAGSITVTLLRRIKPIGGKGERAVYRRERITSDPSFAGMFAGMGK